jgi:hypothetical protein
MARAYAGATCALVGRASCPSFQAGILLAHYNDGQDARPTEAGNCFTPCNNMTELTGEKLGVCHKIAIIQSE